MNTIRTQLQRFLKSEDGPTTVEYAVMLALIILVCFASIAAIGAPTTSSFTSVVSQGGFS